MSDVQPAVPTVGTAAATTPRRTADRLPWPWLIAALVPIVAAVASTVRVSLNGDVTYVFGSIRAAGLGGVDLSDVFVVRPYLYRLVIDGLDHGRQLVTADQTSWLAETVVRLQANVVVALVAILLFAALRRRTSTRPFAGPVALAVGAALMLAPNWSFLQPDWVATVASVLTVGAVLYPRRAWLGVLLGSLTVWMAIAVKTPTFAWAAIALVAVAWVSLRRAVAVGVGAVVVTGVWYVLTKHFQPWEFIWLSDQASMAKNSPLNHGLQITDFGELSKLTANVALLNPILVGAPAAAVLLIARARGRRLLVVATLVVVAGLSVASPYAQGQWFMYHFVGMPVVAAGLWGVALGRRSPARIALLAAPVVATGYSLLVTWQPYTWRKDHLWLAGAGLAIIVIAAVVAALLLDRGPAGTAVADAAGGPWLALVGLVAAIAMVVPYLPKAPYSFDAYNANLTIPEGQAAHQQFQAVRDRVGPDTRVTYFAFGSYIYALGFPTTCRYPSPLFLQRATIWPKVVTQTRSYTDNLKCLDNDGGAKYLVLQPSWFRLKYAAEPVRRYAAQFDCSLAARVPGAPAGVVICPRRS